MIYFTCIAEGLFCYGTLDYCLSYLMDESLHRISTVTLFGYAKDDGKDEIEIFCCNWKNKLNLSIVEPINYWSSVWLLNKDFKFGQSHRGFFLYYLIILHFLIILPIFELMEWTWGNPSTKLTASWLCFIIWKKINICFSFLFFPFFLKKIKNL